MTVERKVLLSLLTLTQEGPISKGLVSKDARVPVQVADDMLEKISGEGLVQLKSKTVEASPNQRVKIAIRAIRLGADFERACRALRWDEFESITATAFLANNFTVTKRFRFRHAGRRWEIDVIGCREPTVACVDCKHWRHGWGKSAAVKAAEAQIERTEALARVLPTMQELGLTDWRKATVIPVILSLVPAPLKFHRNTPIVPILQLQNFLDELPAHTNTLKHILVNL
jgi:Holliday junction resolvase-like predicted endonuclease